MAKLTENLQAVKRGAQRLGDDVKQRATDTRLNMTINRKLALPFKAMKQSRRAAIAQLAELYKANTISTSEFNIVAHRFETQLVADVNEAMRNMVVAFMTDEATQQFDFDAELVHDVQLSVVTPTNYVKLAANPAGKSISNATKRAVVLQAGQMAISQAAKLRTKTNSTGTTKRGSGVAKGLAVDAAVAGIGMAAETIQQQLMARKQFKVSGLQGEYDSVLQQVAEQVEAFKASLQVADPGLKLLPMTELIDDVTDQQD